MNDVVEKANQVSDELDAAIYVYSGGIDGDGFGQLVQSMQVSDTQPYKKNALLILTTNGGLADEAYQIARLLQQSCDRFYLCIPSRCKSAGTLVALGAHEIYMSHVAEFGPLDVQLVQRDEIGERRSGMVVRAALSGLADETYDVWEKIMLNIKFSSRSAISFDVASRLAAEMAVGVMAPVYAQINPEALGNDLRDLNVATAYGTRLAKQGQNAKDGAVRRLVEDYPAHGFIIDRAETGELFNHVNDITGSLADLIAELGVIVYSEQERHCVLRLDKKPEVMEDGTNVEKHANGEDRPGLDEERERAGGSHSGGIPKGAKRKKGSPGAKQPPTN